MLSLAAMLVLSACSDESNPSSGKNPDSAECTSSSSWTLSSSEFRVADAMGTMIDSRDGQIYKTVKIGVQTWMAENLNFKTNSSFCYNNKENFCTKYGRLYLWAAAMGMSESECGEGFACSLPLGIVQGVCPSGWHLPTLTDWNTLFSAVGGSSTAGKFLKSTVGWKEYNGQSGNGTDAFGFSALPAGNRYFEDGEEDYYYEGTYAYFWSSIEYNSSEAYHMHFYYNGVSAYLGALNKSLGHSVRCLQNDTSSSSLEGVALQCKNESEDRCEYGKLEDSRDGQTYKTVIIGSQMWMAQNLNYEVAASYCYNDSVNNCAKYGRLYTWAAATSVCPGGWHLPTLTEWQTLFSAVAGGPWTVGNFLKSTSGWIFWNGRMDAFGFSALPTGYRDYKDEYRGGGLYTGFWSSTESDSDNAYFMDYNDDFGYLKIFGKNSGFSVRCLKN